VRVTFLKNMCMVSDLTSKTGNIKVFYELHTRSDLKFIIRLQKDV
jgi:hypothetical protein